MPAFRMFAFIISEGGSVSGNLGSNLKGRGY